MDGPVHASRMSWMRKIFSGGIVLGLSLALAAGLPFIAPDVRTVKAADDDSIPIDEAHFPDEYFRKYLKGELENTSSRDSDGDGSLSKEERAAVTGISVYGEPIKDLTGIGYFPDIISSICPNMAGWMRIVS